MTPVPGGFRAVLLLLCACSLFACSRDDGPASSKSLAVDARHLLRPFALVPIAQVPHREVSRRLGSHRLEAHTQWNIAPPPQDGYDSAPANLTEEGLVEVDRSGNLHVVHNNEHGYGTEAVLADGKFYMRMRYGPFIHRRPAPDEVDRLLSMADNSAALLELLGPFLKVGEVTAAQVSGRPALQLGLGLRDRPAQPKKPKRKDQPEAYVPGRKWRQATRVLSLDGTAVIDSEKGVLLGLRLEASFTAPRPQPGAENMESLSGKEGTVRIDVNHWMTLSALGENVPVAAPQEYGEQPVRARPMLDRQELLDGLVPR